jgi:hypothetical protein
VTALGAPLRLACPHDSHHFLSLMFGSLLVASVFVVSHEGVELVATDPENASRSVPPEACSGPFADGGWYDSGEISSFAN